MRRALTVRALVAVTAVAVVGAVGCGGGDDASGDSDPVTLGPGVGSVAGSDDSSEGGVRAATDLLPGDCFDGLAVDEGRRARVALVEVVPCSAPHDLEVFHAFTYGDDEAWPGEDEMVRLAEVGCGEAFATQLGERAALEQLAVWPTEASWAEGDRVVVCAAYAADGDALVGNLR